MTRKADITDCKLITDLALLLWPHHTRTELEEEITGIMKMDTAAFFLAYEMQQPVGFAQCQLRFDYVQGCKSSPVGYLEGIYVSEGSRRKGIAKHLLASCEAWSKDMGCEEFASDCNISNTESLQFHLKMGFEEESRIICFKKKV
ncbi:aminoglycoside 6'-N-acetyltransferase [Anaerocolumna sp. MB42-C2]|uniref:aminoglycoside 6'-N-acetyltransferase n=1 Tax=Anaerocolumna sp. MB42-C2 TaxID=3070997 RepID=UPI0027E12E76|nr:aminoglycoside 6'-N-acetyltransferase [Anaerocolumna sp. MB42-C2]WMJ86664.1 GNAT family N-acetyltransferase [Anaerocolumna sp. MB42-C2]